MLKLLFSSETRAKLLALLIVNPKNKYYLRELVKLVGVSLQAAQRELAQLEHGGLISKNIDGNRTYYQINSLHFLFPELKSIIFKTVGFGEALKNTLLPEKEIETAFIYGSYAENKETINSDIDLFIVGTISGKKLQSLLRRSAQVQGRAVNPIIFTPKEFREKKSGHFISTVLKGDKMFLKGSLNER